MNSINHLIKFITNLVTLSATNTTNKSKNLYWEDKHTTAFTKIKIEKKTIIENKHFNINNETRVKCDASEDGLGACLKQKQGNAGHPIAYPSKILNKNEQRYLINELEL